MKVPLIDDLDPVDQAKLAAFARVNNWSIEQAVQVLVARRLERTVGQPLPLNNPDKRTTH